MFWAFMDNFGIPALAIIFTLWLIIRAQWWALVAVSAAVAVFRAMGLIH